MGRMITASFPPTAQTAAHDLFEILAPALVGVKVHSLRIWQTTELGDAAEETLNLTFTRGVGAVTSGSGGTTPDIHQVDNDDAAGGSTVEARNTTQMAAGSGSLEIVDRDGWMIRQPYSRIYTPEERPKIKAGERLAIGLSAPADSTTIGAAITYEEG